MFGDYKTVPEMIQFAVFFLAGNFLVPPVAPTQLNVPGQLKKVVDIPSHHRVIGGQDALPGQLPYMLSLKINGHHICGASFVQNVSTGMQYALTAAHCFHGYSKTSTISEITVTGGTLQISGNGSTAQCLAAKTIIEHQDFNHSSFENDIAIILFSNKFEINDNVSPVSLPKDTPSDFVRYGMIAGWGFTNFSEQVVPNLLQMAEVSVFSSEECQQIYGNGMHVLNTSICAGSLDGGISGCLGDSGGPLVAKRSATSMLIGITSGGAKGCPAHKFPGIYTSVSNYKNWIYDALAPF